MFSVRNFWDLHGNWLLWDCTRSVRYPGLGEFTFLYFMIPFRLIFLAAFMDQGFKQEISFMLLM